MQYPQRTGSWPPGMAITVDTHAQPLLVLLYVRQAWSLAETLHLPALYPIPDTGCCQRPASVAKPVWERRWLSLWGRAWGWYGPGSIRIPGSLHDRQFVTGLAMAQAERGVAFWSTRFGAEGIDAAGFDAWEMDYLAREGELDFERVEPVLVAAWERGLRGIVELPLSGPYLHRLSDTHLVASSHTLRNEGELAAGLAGWIRGS